ncbi:MAG: alpha-ketoglutarate-dependent dioxygenase AlkB [Verrucomicrobiota bacterium]
MAGIDVEPEHRLVPSFLLPNRANQLFTDLVEQVEWDASMKARKTACYGETYDESGVDFEVREMHPLLAPVCEQIGEEVGFQPTNCLLNYYEDGQSTMGFHSDTISNLEDGTGIVIVSLGAERSLTFRHKENYELRHSYPLPNGSLFLMTQRTQEFWMHAVKKASTDEPRISITFRRILAERKTDPDKE